MPLLSRSESLLTTRVLSKDDVVFKPHVRARHYVARIDSEGQIVVTVPRGGNRRFALSFANQHREWLLEQQAQSLAAIEQAAQRRGLRAGDFIWYRGMRTRLTVKKDWGRPVLVFADQKLRIADADMDLSRPLAEHLKAKAKEEIPALVFEYAQRLNAKVFRAVVRDQKTRWGSCSTNGTISLNWRLALAPDETRDYVIIHELMHLKRFDHSASFWRLVKKACPEFREHERWLNEHQDELNW